MNRGLRETLRAIKGAGGTEVEVAHGGKHTQVSFRAADGRRHVVAVSQGTSPSLRAERGLRSRLRRGGEPRWPQTTTPAGGKP